MACCAGTAQKQNSDVRCHSSQDQNASVQKKGPNTSRLAPPLQQQWDHAANAHVGPIDITPQSGRKVWWTCEQCPDGHLHRLDVWQIEPEAMVVPSASGARCASTTLWPPRHPRWQLSGTTEQMIILLKMWSHKATSQLGGCVRFVATHGVQHPVTGSAKRNLAAHSVLKMLGPSRGLSTQLLQRLRTLEAKLSWQNGTMNAIEHKGTSLTTSACIAPSRSSGSATSAQRGSSTSGLPSLIIGLANTRQAAQSVLGMLLANATPCKRCTLP